VPDTFSIFVGGKRKVDDEAHPANECFVEILLHVRGQYDDAAVLLHPLQQIGRFNVCVAVVRVFHFRAFSE